MSQSSFFDFFNVKKARLSKLKRVIDSLILNSRVELTSFKKGIVNISFYEHFNEKETQEHIKLIKKIYFILRAGGYGFNEYDPTDIETIEGAKNIFPIDIDRFWSATLLTPEEVKKYGGKEKILKAPAEVIEKFEDGAIFILINKISFSSSYEQRKKLREYFGEKNEFLQKLEEEENENK